MTYNYGPIAEKAAELVAKFGRKIELVKLAHAAPDDTPWNDVPTEVKVTFDAIQVEPASYVSLGLNLEVMDFLKRSDKVFIIATDADLSVYHKVLDTTQAFTITGMTSLQPGSTRLLWYVGVGG